MAVVLSLLAALAYGLSDFVGGLAARRSSSWTIAWCAQLGGALLIGVAAAVRGGTPTGADLAWATLAGVGNGLGTAFLYRGLAAGRMGVVGPISAVGAALVPVLAAVLGGERPSAWAWTGIATALPAIWLVAREPDVDRTDGARVSLARGVLDGVAAGVGFGVLFAALGQVSDDAGLAPLALNQVVGAVVVAVAASSARQVWWPRHRRDAVGLVPGLLGGTATTLFLVGAQAGYLSVAAVLTSLYPAFTVLLAAALLHERIGRVQAAGLALGAVAVGLIVAA